MPSQRLRLPAWGLHGVLSRGVLALSLAAGPPAQANGVCGPWPDGTVCRPSNPCLGSGVCQAGNCIHAPPLPAGTVCLVSSDPCRADSKCDGAGNCVPGPLRPPGTVCQFSHNPCLGNSICNAAGQCVQGSMLPAGTICRISSNPCVSDSVCNPFGQCVAGAPMPAGTVCAKPTACRAAGTCDAFGHCVAGEAINEGRPCIGENLCEHTICQSGLCLSVGPRDCSGGDPCRKADACLPDVGCLAVNICDMDASADLSGTAEPSPPDGGDIPDAGGPTEGRLPDWPPFAPDGGDGLEGADEVGYRLPAELVGGACQCRLGGGTPPGSPLMVLLLLVCSVRLRARRCAQPATHSRLTTSSTPPRPQRSSWAACSTTR